MYTVRDVFAILIGIMATEACPVSSADDAPVGDWARSALVAGREGVDRMSVENVMATNAGKLDMIGVPGAND